MEVKKHYKLRLCKYYKKGICNKSKEECDYAHGEDDIREFKKICNFGLNCFKKDCQFIHPEGWNPEKNKKKCKYYKNGFCRNGDNCEFKHIKEEIKEENKEVNKKLDKNLDINSNNEFPPLKEDTNSNITKEESINNKNNENEQIKNKKNIKVNEKDEIFEENIKISEIEINKEDKILDVNDNNKFLHLENTNTNNFKNDEIKNKDLSLNINEDTNIKENDEIQDFIIKLQKISEEYIKEIKNNIDKIFIEDKQIYSVNMKLELNKIMSEIILFKNNYQDIINNNEDKDNF